MSLAVMRVERCCSLENILSLSNFAMPLIGNSEVVDNIRRIREELMRSEKRLNRGLQSILCKIKATELMKCLGIIG